MHRKELPKIGRSFSMKPKRSTQAGSASSIDSDPRTLSVARRLYRGQNLGRGVSQETLAPQRPSRDCRYASGWVGEVDRIVRSVGVGGVLCEAMGVTPSPANMLLAPKTS
jgi:hypothetical protein